MTVYLVRHAKAGSRRNWSGDDDTRPISKAGQRQANAIAEALKKVGITRIVSSPYVRCIQTVEPLAKKLGIPIDRSDALAEGAPLAEAVALVDKLADENVVLCSHGDVTGEVLMHLADNGVRLDDFRVEKGSTWVLDTEHRRVVSARYVPPRDS